MSSISPIETKVFAAEIDPEGLRLSRCARIGRRSRREGGEPDDHGRRLRGSFDTVKPLFDMMGKNISLIGESARGRSKVANQVIVAATIEAVGEALLFASKAGVDPEKVRRR